MKIKALSLLLLLAAPVIAHASYTYKSGKWVPSQEMATESVGEHFSRAKEALENSHWQELIRQSLILVRNFPETPFAQEALYYLGLANFSLQEYELANHYFSDYLKSKGQLKYFEEAIQKKYEIATAYAAGAKKHMMGAKSMPKWVPAREDAFQLFDEVVSALPHHELGARSLFEKGKLLLKDEEYKASIESFQTVIKRFPKHPLAIESYIAIENVYLTQSKEQYPDNDFLDLAEINLKKFKEDFPGEERVAEATELWEKMREVYAHSLYETGQFFERVKKPKASLLYYAKVLSKYPGTDSSKKSLERMESIEKALPKAEKIDHIAAVDDSEKRKRNPLDMGCDESASGSSVPADPSFFPDETPCVEEGVALPQPIEGAALSGGPPAGFVQNSNQRQQTMPKAPPQMSCSCLNTTDLCTQCVP